MSDVVDTPQEETPPVVQAEPEKTITIGGQEYTMADLEKLVSGQKKEIQQRLPDDVATPGTMLLAEVQLQVDQMGSTLNLRDVTPAELMFLAASYAPHCGGRPVKKLVLEVEEEKVPVTEHHEERVINGQIIPAGDVLVGYEVKKGTKTRVVTRTPVEERNRLFGKYGKLRVQAMYPGSIPQMPTTYNEAVTTGLSAELPSGPEPNAALLTEKDIGKR
jgi:hypothetical protein